MKNVFRHHEFLDNLLGKQGLFRSPEQKDEALHFASLSRFQELYGDDADYQPGAPLPRRAWQLTQGITDKLQAFVYEKFYTAASLPDSRLVALPAGFMHLTAFRFMEDVSDDYQEGRPLADVKILDDDKVVNRFNSGLIPPSQKRPIAEVLAGAYRVTPGPAHRLQVKGLVLPTRPVYAYTVDAATGQVVYDDAASTDFQWTEIEHNDMLMKAAEILAVPLQDGQLVSFTRTKAQTGA